MWNHRFGTDIIRQMLYQSTPVAIQRSSMTRPASSSSSSTIRTAVTAFSIHWTRECHIGTRPRNSDARLKQKPWRSLSGLFSGRPILPRLIATFRGGMGRQRLDAIKLTFNAAPDKEPLRVLIATDAAREGVNFPNYCADLFHSDVPWNPSRMEQRNGRIDRKLSRNGRPLSLLRLYAEV
jgi:ERCC4-related helicase